jgi:subtilisin-like proprotein convertase family protein
VDGIPVRWGRLAATINNGNLVLIGTEAWGNVRIGTKPVISSDDALRIGYNYAGGQQSGDKMWMKPQLEIVPFAPADLQNGEAYAGPVGQGYGHRLVWTFGFIRQGDPAAWQASVDARTGEVIEFKDTNDYVTKKISGGIYPVTDTGVCPDNARCGTMQPNSSMPWANTGFAAPDDFTNSAGLYNYTSGTLTTTFNGKYVKLIDTCGAISATSATGDLDLGGVNGDHDCTVPAGSSAGNTAATRSAFYEVNKLAELARGWLPSNVWLPAQLQTTVNIGSTCNAYYSSNTINFYKSGGGCRNTGEIAAVFDHEWGHGLDYHDTNGTASVTSESYADIAAIYRLQQSCVGYGFWWTSDQGCGMTSDGTGFNGDNGQTSPACELDCSGVRGVDYAKHTGGVPDTPANFSCTKCQTGSGPCGREVHCDAMPASEAAWDLAARDLQAAPFNYDSNTAFALANKLFYQGSGNVGAWHACTCPSTSNGCGATNAYMQWLAADDDNGNVNDGTPHMTALYAAWDRHAIACATPTPVNSGCAGGPTTAPTLSVAPGSNQVVLSWTPVAGAVNYWVFRGEGFAGCDFGKALIAKVAGTTYTDNQVANGREYYYNVVAAGTSESCFTPMSSCIRATPQPCAGSVSLDKSVYNCHDTVGINLVDSDLLGGGTQVVTVWSTTEPTPENVILTENPPSSGIYTGTIPTTAGAASNGDGLLSVSSGDTLTVKYTDVSYCGTPNVDVTQGAPVDCMPPVISGVFSNNISGSQATINWATDEPATSVVHYGRTIATGLTDSSGTFVITHNRVLRNLLECSLYYYWVESADPAGNNAGDNNGGAYYTFRTLKNVSPNYSSTDTPVAIPDNTPTGASSTIAVTDTNVVVDVNVTVNITHTYDGDLSLSLIGPNGAIVQLSTRRGASGDNFTNTVFDDQATTPIASGAAPFTGSFIPETPLSVLNGIPATGNWTLKVVDGAGADVGSITSWTLNLTYPVEDCGATLRLDAESYNCGSVAGISVKDTTLVGQPSLTVTVASGTEATPETVTLYAQAPPRDDTFLGSIPLTSAPPVSGDGLLSVADGDTVTVTYLDLDDGQGNTNVIHTDTAATDCVAPVITGVVATNVTGGSARIDWTTNEPATSSVLYGLSIPPSSPASTATLVTTHAQPLTGLQECAQYYFGVSSTDAVGNTASDNNAGAWYGFRTTKNVNPTYAYPGPAVPIPDNTASGASATVTVTDPSYVTDVNVRVNVTHPNDGDLVLSLVGPTGTTVTLSNRRGSTGDNFINTVFDDAATTPIGSGTAPFTGSYIPDAPLSAFNGSFAPGVWTLRAVDAATGSSGQINDWALILSYPNEPCGAKLWLNAGTYSCTSLITITVKDGNLAGATLTVAASSGTETTPETVTLTRMAAPYDTWFQGTLQLTGGAPLPSNGQLSVVNGDTVSVTYVDADDGQGNTNVPVTTTAAADCAAPAITGVSATNVTGNSAQINWATNEAATSVVHYGPTIPPALTASVAALVSGHVVPLAGLSPCTTYYYSVESTDAYGNMAVDNNGGAYHGFTTGQNVHPTYTATDVPVSIPDNNAAGATSTINVTDNKVVQKATVRVNITHTFDGDLTLHLVGPDGTDVVLSNRRGSSGDNFVDTVFDDDATTPIASGTAPFTGSFKPDTALSAFIGKNALGAWKLKVVDSASVDTGSITGWELSLTYPAQSCGAAVEYQSSQRNDTCNGTGSGGGNGVIEPGETVTLPVTAHNNGTMPVSGVSAVLSTATPGVTITDNYATFPDMATDAVAVSNPDHFAFVVDPSFPCGGTIAFTIQFTTIQGTFSSNFSLPTGTPGQTTTPHVSTDVPKVISDNATVTSNVTVAETGTVQKVTVTVSQITHTWDGDLVLTLIGPTGTRVVLSNRHGSSGDNYTNTVFDDAATTPIASGTPPYTGSFKPDAALSALNGVPANGTWKLEIQDAASGDTGTLTGWSISVTTTGAPSCLSCTPTQTAGEATNLRFLPGSKTALEWSAALYATSYNLYRGVAAGLPALLTAGADSCTRLSTAGTSTGSVITENPPSGGILWYLVRGQNGLGEGPAGNATAGPRVQNSAGACP